MCIMGADMDLCALDGFRQHCECITRDISVNSQFVVNIDIEIIAISTWAIVRLWSCTYLLICIHFMHLID